MYAPHYNGARSIDQTRALLNELMGTNRNLPSHKRRRRQVRWYDKDMCEHFLCGWCPKRQFVGTKVDMGSCSQTHNEIIKIQFQQQPFRKQRKYWERYWKVLESVEGELQFRIRRSHERLALQAESYLKQRMAREYKTGTKTRSSKLTNVRENIAKLEVEIEVQNKKGVTSELRNLVERLEILKRVENELQDSNTLENLNLNAEVCMVCGGLQDLTQEKLCSHTRGRIHQGFDRLSEEIKKCQEKLGLSCSSSMSSSSSRSSTPPVRRGRRRHRTRRSHSSSSESSASSSVSRSRSRSYSHSKERR